MTAFSDTLAGIGLLLSFGASIICWRRIWKSDERWYFKLSSTLMSAIPFFGPFLYAFLETTWNRTDASLPARSSRKPLQQETKLLRHWNANEHKYVSWATLVFVLLGVLAWWLHGWSPGKLYVTVFGVTAQVVETHYALLIIAVLVFAYIDHKRRFYKRMRDDLDTQGEDNAHTGLPPPSLPVHGRRKKGRRRA